MKSTLIIIFIVFLLVVGIIFYFSQKSKESFLEPVKRGKMEILSPAFENNSLIPKKYTCDGENINPPLEIKEVPEGAKSLVLIVDDPDAPMGTFLHWLVFNINPEISRIEENSLLEGAIQGKNDFGKLNYGGPCPPTGVHRYYFKIYALDTLLELDSSSRKKDVEKAMNGNILDWAELVGLYQR